MSSEGKKCHQMSRIKTTPSVTMKIVRKLPTAQLSMWRSSSARRRSRSVTTSYACVWSFVSAAAADRAAQLGCPYRGPGRLQTRLSVQFPCGTTL